MIKGYQKKILVIGGGLVIVAGIVGYGEYRRDLLVKQLKASEVSILSNIASTTVEFQAKITEINNQIGQLTGENISLNDILQTEQSKNSIVNDQIGKIYDTVGTLDKLSKTDPQLLQKYSKIYFLNEHYTPPALTTIDPKYLLLKDRKLEIYTNVWPYLEKLLKAAEAAKIDAQIISAYRSFGTQSSLKASYKFTYGAGTANQFSADQGYSEHQLGTTLDFTTASIADADISFKETPAYKWLLANAHKYGFTLSYPENNKYYEYEPWHWRFVGIDLATRLSNDRKYFYDLDQRDLNKYLLVIFD